MIHDTFVNPPC